MITNPNNIIISPSYYEQSLHQSVQKNNYNRLKLEIPIQKRKAKFHKTKQVYGKYDQITVIHIQIKVRDKISSLLSRNVSTKTQSTLY